jgi:polyisoprenoid-binding protein YceI
MDVRERWQVDPSRSKLVFALRHVVVSEIRGELTRWGGDLILDPDQPTRAKVDVWVDPASIETGDYERDAHVRSAEFLDVARFPRAEFRSTQIESARDGVAVIRGRLELHGVPRDIELEVSSKRSWVDAEGHMRSDYQVRATIDRQEFGLHWNQDLDVGGIVVGDKIEINAEVQMVRFDGDVLRMEGNSAAAAASTD